MVVKLVMCLFVCMCIYVYAVEKDTHGDVLWTWVYPSLSADLRQSVMRNCCLTWDGVSSVVPFVYTQSRKQWLYLRTEATDQLSKVCFTFMILIGQILCNSVDFHFNIFVSCYTVTHTRMSKQVQEKCASISI